MATTKKQKKAEDLPLGTGLLQTIKKAIGKRRTENQAALKKVKKARNR